MWFSLKLGPKELRESISILECKIKIDFQLCMLHSGKFDGFWSSLLFFFLFPYRLIELHSPDSRNTLILRCKDTATAHSWFVAIHTNIMALLPQVLAELNAMLGATSTAGSSKEVKHIAWLAEQVGWEAGQGLTGSPFRAKVVPPFHISIIFIMQQVLDI